jgi:hypothetical protein
MPNDKAFIFGISCGFSMSFSGRPLLNAPAAHISGRALWQLRPVMVNSGEYVRYVAFQAGLRQVVQALQGICRLGASFLSGCSEGSSLLLQLPLCMCLLPLNFPPPFLSFLPLQLQFTLRFELFDARFAARIFP